MKSMWNLLAVLSVVVLVSACGDKKGGVNDSGVEADGKCSGALIGDIKSLVADVKDAGANNDRPKAKAACTKFTTKYGRVSCISPETGKRFEGQQMIDACNQL